MMPLEKHKLPCSSGQHHMGESKSNHEQKQKWLHFSNSATLSTSCGSNPASAQNWVERHSAAFGYMEICWGGKIAPNHLASRGGNIENKTNEEVKLVSKLLTRCTLWDQTDPKTAEEAILLLSAPWPASFFHGEVLSKPNMVAWLANQEA